MNIAILLHMCWFVVSVYVCGGQIVVNSTQLRFEPTNVIVQEGSNVSLTCNISNTEEGVYYIRSGDNVSYVYHPQENCRVTGALTNTQTYSVRCINEDVQITILNTSRDRHGEIWTCRRNMFEKIYESNCTITVKVPTASVKMLNWTRYTATKEKLETIFVCVTSSGYPEAVIGWYKNNALLLTNGDTSISSSSTTASNSYLITVTSTLKIQLERGDNTSTIHCAANNNNITSIHSNKTSVLVYYAPEVPVLKNGSIQIHGDITVIEGSTIAVTCTANSFPEPQYVWNTQRSSVSGHSLTLYNITRDDGGRYTCRATNTMKLSSGKSYQGENEASVVIKGLSAAVSDPIDESGILLPAVSGGAAAVSSLIICVTAVLIVRYKRRRTQRNHSRQQCAAAYEASSGVCDLQVYENVIIYDDVDKKTAKQTDIELPMYENVHIDQPKTSTRPTKSKQPRSKAKHVVQQRPLKETYENLILDLQCERKYN